jgi:hypothetical protein
MGAVLKQVQEDGIEKPVAYFSRKFNDAQRKKKAIYLECIAIKEAVRFWQYWLLGISFTIYTDHKLLENLNLRARTNEELGNLTHYLSQFDFNIKYNPGGNNIEADCLSRNPVNNDHELTDILKTTNMLTLQELLTDQQITEQDNNTDIRNDIKYRQNTKRIIISENLGRKLIKIAHDNFGHIGSRNLINLINKDYYFKNATKKIINLCKSCSTCIKNKTRSPVNLGTLGLLGPATQPFQIMSFDTIGGFGGRRSTKKYLHCLTDHFTRHAYILTSATQQAKDVIKLIQKTISENDAQIGILLTDQYPSLTSNEFQEFLKTNHIDSIFTSVNCAFSNGLNERLNQTLVNRIRCRINNTNENRAWTTVAHKCVDDYNNTPHSSTGYAPRYLLTGESRSILPAELTQLITQEDWYRDRQKAIENALTSH